MPTLPPVPNTPLRDDPSQDSIWKRWLDLLKASYAALGTVTSVAVSGGTTGLTTSGGPITTSGTITLTGTLIAANGGTGLSSIGTAHQVIEVNSGASALQYTSWPTLKDNNSGTLTIDSGFGLVIAAPFTNSGTINNSGIMRIV